LNTEDTDGGDRVANIGTANASTTFQLKRWLGLNESPDGDVGLKLGEAAAMRNFRITREGHLQLRPGYASKVTLAEGYPVRGLWSGYVDGVLHFLAACGGKVWDIDPNTWKATQIGEIDDAPTHFFGFSQKVYILTGSEFYVWSGVGAVSVVEGYVPTVVTAAPPTGGGTVLERVNLLTGKKKAKYSPDGTATVFYLPEAGIDEFLGVEGTSSEWKVNPTAGTVTFTTAPAKGVNTLTFTWRKGDGVRDKVARMRFSETYNGSADSRVFLYGDGTNEAIYSDLDGAGRPSAEYFPDMNVIAIDSANTPITAMIRHYDRLLAFKPDGAFSVEYSTMTLYSASSSEVSVENTLTAAFYCTPLNREIGCTAPGQAVLVKNNPRTLHGSVVYDWALSGAGSRDERNAKRISDRVEGSLSYFDMTESSAYDDEPMQEYYVLHDGIALIHNYGNDTWYRYSNFPALCMERFGGELYFGTPDGNLMHLSRDYRNDNGAPIDAYWESGSMDFSQDWRRKYSSNIWVSVKPERRSSVTVTAQSNRKSDYMKKTVAGATVTSFAQSDFGHWSFITNAKPQMVRVRLKVKKFAFYKLIFESLSTETTTTVLGVDMQVRYTGNVK
jgi:hypothetical protein